MSPGGVDFLFLTESKMDMYGIFGALCDQVEGVKVDQEPSFPIFNALGKDIVSEKAKIGGDWVIAGFIPTRLMRDVIRKACNINATFINLIIDSELQKKRIEKRHRKGNVSDEAWIEVLTGMHKIFEPTQENEDNTFDLKIGEDMTIEQVVEQVMEMIKKVPNHIV